MVAASGESVGPWIVAWSAAATDSAKVARSDRAAVRAFRVSDDHDGAGPRLVGAVDDHRLSLRTDDRGAVPA